METGEQEPIPMDAEMQEEPTMPFSEAATDEPVIPTDLECQVKTMEEAATQEMVIQVMEEAEPMKLPSIETRTVETLRGNYMMINTRILQQLGRMEVSAQGPAKPVWVASRSKSALGPAEVPGMVEVELVQTAQATTSQTASLTGNQEPAGDEQSNTWRTQGEGYDTPDSDSGDTQGGEDEGGDNEAPPVCPNAPGAPRGGGSNGEKGAYRKGKQIGKQPAGKRRKEMRKKKMVTPAVPLVKKTDQPKRGGPQDQGPCLMAGQKYPSVNKKLAPLRVAKAREFKSDGRIEIMDWTEKQIKECHEARMEVQQVIHRRY